MSRSHSFKYHRGSLNAVWNYAAGVSGWFSAEVELERGRGAGGGTAHCGSLRTDPSPLTHQQARTAAMAGFVPGLLPTNRSQEKEFAQAYEDVLERYKGKNRNIFQDTYNVAKYGFIYFFTTLKSAYGTSWKCYLSCLLLAEREKDPGSQHFCKFTFDQTFQSTLFISNLSSFLILDKRAYHIYLQLPI